MSYTIIDPQCIINNMYGNDAMLKQFIALYLEQTPKDIHAIEQASLRHDQLALKKAAHHLRPTLQYIGAIGLYEDIKKLELATEDATPWRSIEKLLEKIKPQLKVLLDELEHYNYTLYK